MRSEAKEATVYNEVEINYCISISLSIICFLVWLYFDRDYSIFKFVSFVAVLFAFLGTISIVGCLFFESRLFFKAVPISDFLFGIKWNPDFDFKDSFFGVVPLLVGTFLISFVALFIAIPISLFSAIYLSEYSDKKNRSIINTALEILASIPTVVYGYFAVIFLSPGIRKLAEILGFNASSENALVAGTVVGIMLLPSMTSLMEHALRSVSKILRYGSIALGATCSETVWMIVIPSARAGIVNAILLSFSRAIGETMIVLMASGIIANLTFNPLKSVTTITVQIAILLTGDQNFDSVETSSAYALGLLLFCLTWSINACALFFIRKKHHKNI